MSSDYEFSDNEGEYYDSDEMMDDYQNDEDEEMEGDKYNNHNHNNNNMNDDDYDYTNDDDFRIPTKSKSKSYQVEYTSLTQSLVEKSMKEEVDHVSGIFGVEPSTATLLLRHLGWNKERLIDKYMENPTQILVDSGCQVPETIPSPSSSHSVDDKSSSSSRRATRSSSKLLLLSSSITSPSRSSSAQKKISSTSDSSMTFTCPICYDDSPSLIALSLTCAHSACSGCWTAYAISKIRDEGEHCIRCMTEGCAVVAPDEFIHRVLRDDDDGKDLEGRFEELVVRGFVASNPKLKFCPYPGCTNTVSCPSAASKSVLSMLVPIVSCGARGIPSSSQNPTSTSLSTATNTSSAHTKEHIFCFGCPIESDHRPVICAVARLWMKKCEDDSETANWIKSNTKECSQCQSTIEKNGGCNHMTCKKCRYEFCWVCMGPWSEHGTAWYSCNRYDEKGGVEARDAQSRSRASLERYLHYYNRWANHEQSTKLSLDLYAKTEKKMTDMQITSSLTWIEVQFMKKAVEALEKCRETLKWTYAMGYYLGRGNEKELFEDNQRDLERAVEDLAELLEGGGVEMEKEKENVGGLRQRITDKTVYVQKRNEIMLEDTAIGFQDGRWKWNVGVDGFEEPIEDFGGVV
ncbi:hypothetical protein F5050DRAFT_448823 [Lentinula boryana]|uniref:RBR-type E3 ubiquitin transferase n=1 Tax=Lentinula boryana TaxID=40481 RepID=A0ABQ8Q832_9AGAR|nr:hypothetical protein F5050DRAFT_448823 [Lentinula boryana]